MVHYILYTDKKIGYPAQFDITFDYVPRMCEMNNVPLRTGEDVLSYWECFENAEEQDEVIMAQKEAIGKLNGGDETVKSLVESINKLLSIPLE